MQKLLTLKPKKEMDCRFNLEELAHDLIPAWATLRGYNDPKQFKLVILGALGHLAEVCLNTDFEKMKKAVGMVFVAISVYHHANGYKANVYASAKMYARADIQDLLILCAKTKSFATLTAVANKLNLDLEECANVAYYEIN